jgi:hypothetical protein
MITFHILVASTNRTTLQNLIHSLANQLGKEDHLTIVFDGHSEIPHWDILSQLWCKVHLFCEPQALGFWGHGIRNKYASLLEPTTFVLHADDDDI